MPGSIRHLDDGSIEYKYYNDNWQIQGYGFFRNGNPEGEHKVWYSNGILEMRSFYQNGTRDGVRTTFYTDGRPDGEEFYRDGALIDPVFTRKKRKILCRVKRCLKIFNVFNDLHDMLIYDLFRTTISFIPT